MNKKLWFRSLSAAIFLGLLGGCSKVDPGQNKRAGEVFLAENAKKEGVSTTPSGL